MSTNLHHTLVTRAFPHDAACIAVMVGELLAEIMNRVGVKAFDFNLEETRKRAAAFMEQDRYVVFLARDPAAVQEAGFIALAESCALYAEGMFGTIPEFYVRPQYRSAGVGRALLKAAREFGASRDWQRLEVTTPPLPQFERTLRFYEREGFAITGGRKLKRLL